MSGKSKDTILNNIMPFGYYSNCFKCQGYIEQGNGCRGFDNNQPECAKYHYGCCPDKRCKI